MIWILQIYLLHILKISFCYLSYIFTISFVSVLFISVSKSFYNLCFLVLFDNFVLQSFRYFSILSSRIFNLQFTFRSLIRETICPILPESQMFQNLSQIFHCIVKYYDNSCLQITHYFFGRPPLQISNFCRKSLQVQWQNSNFKS